MLRGHCLPTSNWCQHPEEDRRFACRGKWTPGTKKCRPARAHHLGASIILHRRHVPGWSSPGFHGAGRAWPHGLHRRKAASTRNDQGRRVRRGCFELPNGRDRYAMPAVSPPHEPTHPPHTASHAWPVKRQYVAEVALRRCLVSPLRALVACLAPLVLRHCGRARVSRTWLRGERARCVHVLCTLCVACSCALLQPSETVDSASRFSWALRCT